MNFDQFAHELERHRAGGSPSNRPDEVKLRNSSLELLGRIDHLLNQYDEASPRQKKRLLLGTSRNVLVECLDHVASVVGPEAVEHILPDICRVRDTLKSLESELSGIAWVRSLLVSSTQHEFVDREYHQLGADICSLCEELLNQIDSVFHQPRTVEQWKASREIALNELRRRW